MLLRRVSILALVLFQPLASAGEQLVFAVDLIRHGDRTPIHEMPNQPYAWKEGLEQLTPQGIHRAFTLGSTLRKEYIEDAQLLPHTYDAKTMHAYSTNKDRTLMTAQSLLMGLYPQGTGPINPTNEQPAITHAVQPIPVHSHDTDYLLRPQPSYNPISQIENYWSLRQEWEALDPELKAKMKVWSKATGMPLTNLKQLKGLADVLYVRKSNGVPLPAEFSDKDVAQIIEYGKGSMVSHYKRKANSYPAGHAFLLEVAKLFSEVKNKKTPLKYVLFSAHDSSILSVMNTLGAPVEEIPPYASRVNFLVYKDDAHHYSVAIRYNGKPVILPQCPTGKCSLPAFEKIAKA